jgi:hypothetical protein
MRFLSEKDVKIYNGARNRCFFKQKLNKGKLIKTVSFSSFETYNNDVDYFSEINGIINICNTSKMNEQKTIFFVFANAYKLSIKEINKKDYDHGFEYNSADYYHESGFIPSYKDSRFYQKKYDYYQTVLKDLKSFTSFLKYIESINNVIIFN